MKTSSIDKQLLEYEAWFEHNLGRAASSVNNYVRTLKRLGEYLQSKGKKLIDADAADLEHFAGPVAHQEGIAPRSRRPLVAAIRSFYGYLEKTEQIDASPAARLNYPKAGKPLPVMMEHANAEKLLMNCDLDSFVGVRDAAILALLLSTGLRVSGVSRMNQEQLFTAKDDNDQPIQMMRVVEKGAKERLVPISPEATTYLQIYLQHPLMVEMKKDLILEDGDHVMFVQTNRGSCEPHEWYGEHKRLSSKGVARIIQRHGEKLGIPKRELHPHAIRHLFGTSLIEGEVDLHRTQMIMGHSKIDTTTIYLHLAVRKLSKDVNAHSPLSSMKTPVHALREELDRRTNKRK